jgi:hypothetical protein
MKSPRSFRATELVKEFARRGHHITLLTKKVSPAHHTFEKEYGITIKDLGPSHLPDIKLSGSNSVSRLARKALRRGLLQLFEYPDIELMFKVKRALKNESGYNLLISIAVPYPIHWGVAWAWRDKNPIADTWVADCGDPYCGLENDTFNKFFYFKHIEKWFSRKADYITIPFEGALSAYFPEFYSKIKIIPQGLSFPEKRDAKYPPENEKITFAYFGNIQSYLHYAIPFLKRLNTVDRDFRFIVYTRDRLLFEQVLNKEALKKCDIRDYVERDVLLKELSDINFLIHFPYLKSSQKSLKLVDYAYLDKPVLSYQNDGESNQILNAFMNCNFENQTVLEDYTKFKIENVTAQFLELIQTEQQFVALR